DWMSFPSCLLKDPSLKSSVNFVILFFRKVVLAPTFQVKLSVFVRSAFNVLSHPGLVISPKFWVRDENPVVREMGTSKIRSEDIRLKYSTVPLILENNPRSTPILKFFWVSQVRSGLAI